MDRHLAKVVIQLLESTMTKAALSLYSLLALRAFFKVDQGLAYEKFFREHKEYLRQVVAGSSKAWPVAAVQLNVGYASSYALTIIRTSNKTRSLPQAYFSLFVSKEGLA